MIVKQFAKLLFASFLDIIYPPFCCYCQKFGAYLCPSCFALIKFYPLPLEIKIAEPELDILIACSEYAEPIKSVIKKMKYQSVKDIGKVLGKMLWQTTNFPQVDLITSVPLYPARKNQRGFNQAEIIAQELARLAQLPYKETLIRTVYNQNQASIKDKTKRLNNLQNIFRLRHSSKHNLPSTILIIDDVTTTGATLNECAKVLKQSGAKKVIGLVVTHGN